MHKSFIISIVYPPTTPAFSHPSFPEGGEWGYYRLVKLPPNLKKNPPPSGRKRKVYYRQ
ncbi:hypothetical protein [Bacteroides caccae]|uniref:hypothetical protein n=1 Tax=Bacteroides caccae TaxID=47678 RepID=UPI003566F37B